MIQEKYLEIEDLYRLNDNLTYNEHFNKYLTYKTQKENEGWSFLKIFVRWLIPFWWFLFAGFFIADLLNIANPFLLKELIEYISTPENDTSRGIGLLIGLSLVAIIRPFLRQHAIKVGYRVMVYVNLIFFGLYHEKLERIKLSALKYINIG